MRFDLLQFMLEDVRCNEKDTESTNDVSSPGWSTSQPTNELPDTANVTLPLRKNNKFSEDAGERYRKWHWNIANGLQVVVFAIELSS